VITNDKGRLSKEQIETMIQDAERLKDEDEKNMKRIEAKNKLESYIYNWRNQMDNNEVSEKLGDSGVETVRNCVKETQEWIDNNTSATTEEFESKMKECETLLNPIATKMYAEQTNEQNMPNMEKNTDSNNNEEIEEVD